MKRTAVKQDTALTAFEREVERLGLKPSQYAHSERLRDWCERNRKRCYIPEALLAKFRMHAEEERSYSLSDPLNIKPIYLGVSTE